MIPCGDTLKGDKGTLIGVAFGKVCSLLFLIDRIEKHLLELAQLKMFILDDNFCIITHVWGHCHHK